MASESSCSPKCDLNYGFPGDLVECVDGRGDAKVRSLSAKREKTHVDSADRERKKVKFSANIIECTQPRLKISAKNEYGLPGFSEKSILKGRNTDKLITVVPSSSNLVPKVICDEELKAKEPYITSKVNLNSRQGIFMKQDIPSESSYSKENTPFHRTGKKRKCEANTSKRKDPDNKEIIPHSRSKKIVKGTSDRTEPSSQFVSHKTLTEPKEIQLRPELLKKRNADGNLKRNLHNDKEGTLKKLTNSTNRELLSEKYRKVDPKDSPKVNKKGLLALDSKSSDVPGVRNIPKKNSLLKQNAKLLEEKTKEEPSRESHRPPLRPTLTRSVSAAAAIGRRPKTQAAKGSRSLKKDVPLHSSEAKKRAEISIRGGGTERRFLSTVEKMRRQIDEQRRQIKSLNERLRTQTPNLENLSQLSVSVPAIYEAEKYDQASRSDSKFVGDPLNAHHDSPRIDASTPGQPHLHDEFQMRSKDADLTAGTMANMDDVRFKSLDLHKNSCNSLESPSVLRYSSLVSLNGNRREHELSEENDMLRAELQETRDHAELLEFRILEFTEGIQRATSIAHTTCDQSTNTSSDDVLTSLPMNEDLSLPLSVDSGLELHDDHQKLLRLSEYRKSLSRLEEASGLCESSSVANLSSLLDWVCSISGGQFENGPSNTSPRSPIQKKMGAFTTTQEDHQRLHEDIHENELTMLAAKLQESLTNPKAQEGVLEETIIKLQAVNSSLSRLQSRVNTLTQENKELQEALTTLHDSHETRTEVSGTESELVHGKTPSLHSDLSDTESDDSSRPAKSSNMETASSFQESGIFETSCEMINAATQTPQQESDEHLVAPLEGEKVTLYKIEYDTIVATERSLQREIEILQYEKEQLALQCASLQEKLQEPVKDDVTEVLRAQVRLLEERLEVSERQRIQYFDEKCEMEEAENDARLLSQRLESQLEAAREMESLLSASLSQEQDFCRDLQRRVREMHQIDRGRRLHEEVLEKESQYCRQREAALMVANDSQKSQLTFALYGLILAQFWRRIVSHNKASMVPYSPSKNSTFSNEIAQYSNFLPSFPCVSDCEQCLDKEFRPMTYVSNSDACTQTLSENYITEEFFVGDEMESVENGSHAFPNETPSTAKSFLSDREEFYISQIESLQKERKILREDKENEQSALINQMQTMKGNLGKLQLNLEESQKDNCRLLFKLEEAQNVIKNSEIELQRQAKKLKTDFTQSVEVYQQEQKGMQDQYEEKIAELKQSIDMHEQRFKALLQQYSILQHELEPYFYNSVDSVDEYGCDEGNNGKIQTTKDLLSAVRELVRSESLTKQSLRELEKKESAYRETINEADRIMSNHVTIYTQKIEDLEAVIDLKSSRIKQLEASEERLRTVMKSSLTSNEGTRITELLDRLIETENSELSLKERVWNLERNGKELQIKFAKAEKDQENLRSELRDQEELVQRLMALKAENNALTSQLQEAHAAARRASEFQQSENYLKNRIDELESSENGLKDTLKQTDHIMLQRERKFRDQISNLEEEVATLRGQLDLHINEAKESKDVENSLRHQIENLKGQIHSMETEFKESSSENICHEAQLRSEVQKLRSQVKLSNTQLTELDLLNGELKEQLTAAECATKEVAIQLEETLRRHENEVKEMNLQINHKDSKIEEFEAYFQQISHSKIDSEFMGASPLLILRNFQEKSIRDLKMCENCSSYQISLLENLNDCFKMLDELMKGKNSQFESESEDSEVNHTEYSVSEFPKTPKTLPVIQGRFTDTPSSGDGETSSVYSLTLTNESTTEGRNSPSSELPSAPPRPRRDAKKKKKIRRTLKVEGSLLEELEDSPSPGKGSFYGSCTSSVALLEELEDKVRELEEVVVRKDEELRLADGEAAELHSRLIEEDDKLAKKTEEANQSSEALVSLRQQFLDTVKEYESARQDLEAKHKVAMSSLTKKIETLTEDLIKVSEKSNLKDKIIGSLVKQIKCILRSGSPEVLINQIRRISINSTGNKMNENDLEICDFDVDSVCTMLEERHIVTYESGSSLEASNYQSLPPFPGMEKEFGSKKSRSASDIDSTRPKIHMTVPVNRRRSSMGSSHTRNLPPLEQNQKSLIPRYRSWPNTPLSSVDIDVHPPLRELPPRNYAKEDKIPRVEKDSQMQKEAKHELKPLAKVIPKQRPVAEVAPKTKSSFQGDNRSRYLSEARRVKRMVAGLVPFSASVDCPQAPEFKKQPRPSSPSCIPRPLDLRITRRVGADGAVIAWKPLEHDCVAGFQVIVGGKVVQQVRSPHRTKALVTGLPFPSQFTIGLVTVAHDGRCSLPTLVSYDKTNTYKSKLHHQAPPLNATPKRALPTCL